MANTGRAGEVRHVLVVGAGVVGLSTAWFLQEHGVRVTVVDRDEPAAGASWGNAGWVSPGLAIPLNEPGVLRYGMRALLDPNAPLSVPATASPGLWMFLLRFAAHCRWDAWERAVRANLPLNTDSLDAFDALYKGGVETTATSSPITALFRSPRAAVGLLRELERINASGLTIEHAALSGEDARAFLPHASTGVEAAVRLDGQRYVDPGTLVRNLAEAVRERGGEIRSGFEVTDIHRADNAVVTTSSADEPLCSDAVVVATGSWFDGLVAGHGVRAGVRAGRGYSFTVPTEEPVTGPVYLPEVRVACTPYQGALRVAGTMEFRGPDDEIVPRRVEAIERSARPYLSGVRWEERTDTWVGPRPVTADGIPLVGATRTPGVYVAGGHGMWGLTHGPATGSLLAEHIVTGVRPRALEALDPLR
ncbi:NAD(P)/FAD-dependent oxidoreductase [Nocardiopsis algeriensis]|uniref:NAD(P)/FAD-dependent oxidoreductase n=1 Tax=Nocardiopsis algeriensis TaxID=1478215 RepID=UPI003B431061